MMLFNSKIAIFIITISMAQSVFAVKVDDPCNDIEGNWTGTFRNTNDSCEFIANVPVYKYNDLIQMQLTFSQSRGRCRPG
jgi:hypothetical protein